MRYPISKEKCNELYSKLVKLNEELKKAKKVTNESYENTRDPRVLAPPEYYDNLTKEHAIQVYIESINSTLSMHEIVDVFPPNTSVVSIFSIVEFKILSELGEPRYVIEIVRHGDEDFILGRYSHNFPIVKAMIGLKEGYAEEIKIGKKEITIEIYKLHNKWPEDISRGLFADYWNEFILHK